MSPRAPNGSGRIDVRTSEGGYVTLRPRVQVNGVRHYGRAVGIRRMDTKRAQDIEERRAWAQARKNLADLRIQLQRGEKPDLDVSRRTFGAQMRRWLASKETRLSARSFDGYESTVRLHLEPYRIAQVAVSNLSGEDLDDWLAEMRARGVKAPTQRYVFTLAMEALRSLIADHPIPTIQSIVLTSRGRRPRHRAEQIRPFDAAERDALLRVLLEDADLQPHSRFLGLALLTGMRYGECAGLTWGEIHWADRSLTVRRQLDKDTARLREPKTQASVRTIPLSDLALHILRERLDRARSAEDNLGPDALVWVHHPWRSRTPWPLSYSGVRKAMLALVERAGLTPSGRVHALRHTFGTAIAQAGTRHAVISDLMGHADPTITHRYTRHTVSEEQRRAVEAPEAKGAPKGAPPGLRLRTGA